MRVKDLIDYLQDLPPGDEVALIRGDRPEELAMYIASLPPSVVGDPPVTGAF